MAAFFGPLQGWFTGQKVGVLPSMKTEQKIGRKLGDSRVARTTFRIVICGCAAIVAMLARVELTRAAAAGKQWWSAEWAASVSTSRI